MGTGDALFPHSQSPRVLPRHVHAFTVEGIFVGAGYTRMEHIKGFEVLIVVLLRLSMRTDILSCLTLTYNSYGVITGHLIDSVA